MTENVNAVLESIQKAVVDLRAEHAEQIKEVKSGFDDVVKAEKVERINAEVSKLQGMIDTINMQIAAGQVGGSTSKGLRDSEYSEAFAGYVRKDRVNASLNKGEADEGGYLAPVEWDRTITDKLIIASPMRQVASVMTISGAGFKKLFNLRGTASGWVGEASARTETATATFGEMAYATGELYANPSATQQMLDDAEVNLEAWLAGEVQTEFAFQEGVAFLSGNGTNRPTGLLTYVTGAANAAAHPFGAVTTVSSGAAAAITADGIINLIYDLPSELTAGARFLMNRSTQNAIRLLKDGQGNYLWQPSYVAGQPSTIAGYPVTEMPGMPDVAANSISVMFGDFARGYLIIDRIGTRVLRDPYTNKPYVMFYTTKRVGGGLLNPEPLRALKTEA